MAGTPGRPYKQCKWNTFEWVAKEAPPCDTGSEGGVMMGKRDEKSTFLDGVLMACQEIVLSHGQDTMAQEIMRASGTMAQFLAAQKRTGYESRHMNAVIREAFREKRTAPAQEKE